MASVSRLGYLGIGVSNMKAWQDLATTVLGMQVIPGDDSSSCYLRMDGHCHRLALRETGTDDVEYVGWEVPDAATLQQIARQLEDGGVKVTPASRAEADERRVMDLVKCVDPDGVPIEIFWGPCINAQPFHPTRAENGFKTGAEGLGHILLHARNLNESVRFYRDLLGFRVSDFTEARTPGGEVRLAFLHCNPRHHSVAFVETAGAPARINHFMVECNSVDDVGSGRDLCLRHSVPIVIDLGRHMNDHMFSFYMANPSGFGIEYGWNGRTIDDATWHAEHYTSVQSLWGHPQLQDLVNSMAPAKK